MSVIVDRFRVVERMGAKVWKCEDFSRAGEIVVVKCVADDNELRVLENVRDDDKFVTLYDAFEHRNSTYVITEYIGYDLLDYLNEKGEANEEEGKRIFVAVLAAVTTLFRVTGYYHADLKAENVVIDDRKNVKLIDFGVMVKRGEKISGLSGGTEEYFPPERTGGTAESFVVWTLGLILYRLLIGTDFPYDEETGRVCRDVASEAELVESEEAADLLRKCLHRNYRKRPSLKDLQKHSWITGRERGFGGIMCCLSKKK